MRNAIVVGGSNGIGLSVVMSLSGYDNIYIVDKVAPACEIIHSHSLQYPDTKIIYHQFDLTSGDYSAFDEYDAVDTLIITAGFGRLALFSDTDETEIEKSFKVNTIGPMRIIHHLYDKINSVTDDFYCAVMVSISGIISSPFFSIYSATKAALHRFIESVNVELEKSGTNNRILEISPGAIKGTTFYGGTNDLSETRSLAQQILSRMYRREILYIPQYDEIFRSVIDRYHTDSHAFGLESYDYKIKSNRPIDTRIK